MIDEKKLLNEMIDLLAKDCKNMELRRKIVGLIDTQPTVQPQTGWIPCSERLPKEEGWYQCSCYSPERWNEGLVRDLYWEPTSQQFVDNIRYSTNGFDDIKKYYWTEWVIAWQPLPQPYKESE